jgi:DNA-binding response OmpR family regulator
MQIIALDTDLVQLEIVRRAMASLGHDFEGFTDATSFMFRLRHRTFDLVLLEDAPGASFAVTPLWIHESVSRDLPVVLLSARTGESDLVAGLDGGADDLIVKPVRVRELQARVQAILRRRYPERAVQRPVTFGPYRFIPASASVIVNGRAIVLRQIEYALAMFLFRNLGRQLSRDYLLSSIWREGSARSHRTVDTHVSRVRAKLALGPANGFLLTSIYGIGYRLEAVTDEPGRSGSAQRRTPK